MFNNMIVECGLMLLGGLILSIGLGGLLGTNGVLIGWGIALLWIGKHV